ncbi:MAG TPA: RCC1 domain-containing protein [Miltoncostaeaceae bacterium]|nr:RCC1 domain-containing protein [Miltoncostaeaceae bacterium]
MADAQTVSVGDEHACAVRAGGAVVCWGSTADGRLGDGFAPEGHYVVMRTPVGVAGLNDAVVPDLVGPVIEIGRPADGEVFALGAVVDSAFTCTDPGSGVAACDGPARVDTSSAGEHTFTVNAVDPLGNRSSRSVRYTVRTPVGAPADRRAPSRVVPAPTVRVTAAAGTRLRVSLRATLWREVAGRAVRIQVRRGARWVPVGAARVTPTGRIATRLVVTRGKLGGVRVRTARLRLVLVRTATAPAMVGRARAVRVPPMRRVVGR